MNLSFQHESLKKHSTFGIFTITKNSIIWNDRILVGFFVQKGMSRQYEYPTTHSSLINTRSLWGKTFALISTQNVILGIYYILRQLLFHFELVRCILSFLNLCTSSVLSIFGGCVNVPILADLSHLALVQCSKIVCGFQHSLTHSSLY